MATEMHHCARCGKSIALSPAEAEAREAVYCSFQCEVKELLDGLGWGARWLGLSLGWGLAGFAAIAMLARAIWGGPVANPASFYGLMLVLGLMTLVLSALRQRFKG